ncbi:YqaJ viral recombinase family protein [Pandoraea sp. SD6-2]|uniref:YqaJ viral recombinase family protein n=1 Tax=Pandoraea sp. SD6-2 TaxID=1286093 RepID=UPI00032DAECF|nr:YqaJ viral recombinase family protein [Pandoraea sp. SD6-2]EON13119.1 phage-type endonuclease [Pandoraea sp. SD6-2]
MTERIIHNLVQGSDEWAQFRLEHFGASEAAAMLGLSSKVKRNELLHMKYVGTPREFSDWVQKNILDYGHEVEALARPIVEGIIGDDLYPVTCSLGRLSASCDGLTMAEDIAFEHKQWNAGLAEAVRAGELPEEYWPQCQQVMLVTGAKKVIFVVSDGTPDNMERIEIEPDAQWFERLQAGWEQFASDLVSYAPVEIVEKPQADAIMALPALAVQICGEVLASNLPTFRAAAERFIEGIKTDLKSDEDFANAEATVKFCETAEKELEVAKNAALAQTASIDELMRTVDYIKSQLREKRLGLDKLVTKRKEEIKGEIIVGGRKAYTDHVAALNAELKPVQIVIPAPDLVAAAKNKRTLASLHDAVDTAVAAGKIAADAAARDLREKLAWFAQHESHVFLFRDLQSLIQKPAEDFQLAVTTRIEQHKRAEAQKVTPGAPAIPTAAVSPSGPTQQKPDAPPWNTTVRAASKGAPTLRLGQINERLSPISLTADGLASLGITHAATDKAAKLYHEGDFEVICAALIDHIQSALQKQAA